MNTFAILNLILNTLWDFINLDLLLDNLNLKLNNVASNGNIESLKALGSDRSFSAKFKNFQLVMDHYIHENYYIYQDVAEYRIFDLSNILLNLETILINFQKVNYARFSYYSDLLNWYLNYKILLDKIIINSTNLENLHSNLSLDLLLDIQSDNLKSLLWMMQYNNDKIYSDSIYENVDVDIIRSGKYLSLFKNYFFMLHDSPYKVQLELIKLIKLYDRSNFFSYGLDYDLNIIKNDKYLISFMNTEKVSHDDISEKLYIHYNILNNLENNNLLFKTSNYKVVDRHENLYFKGIDIWNGDVLTENLNQEDINIESKYNAIILDKFNKSASFFTRPSIRIYHPFVKKGFYLITSDWFKSRFNNKRELLSMFGSYSYWWGWHQDAVSLHGSKGPGGAPLWDDYTWFKRSKVKYFYVYKSHYVLKLKHGSRVGVAVIGRITRTWPWMNFDWDIRRKKRFLKYIIHGRRVWEIEKYLFRTFLLSNDIWVKNLHEKNISDYYGNYKPTKERLKFQKGNSNLIDQHSVNIRYRLNYPSKFVKKRKITKYWMTFASYSLNDAKYVSDILKWKRAKIYRYIISDLENKLIVSKIFYDKSMASPIRGFLTKEFILDLWYRKDKIELSNVLTNNNEITWKSFYTNIESISEPLLNLNYINKNFNGKHLNSNVNIFVTNKYSLHNNLILPANSNILLKKAYIENLVYVYQLEENPMINYMQFWIKLKTIHIETLVFFKKIYQIYTQFVTYTYEVYTEGSAVIWHIISRKLMRFEIIRTFVEYYNIIKEYFIYLKILFLILLYNIVCWILISIIKTALPKKLFYGVKSYYSDFDSKMRLLSNPMNRKNVKLIEEDGEYHFIERLIHNLTLGSEISSKSAVEFFKPMSQVLNIDLNEEPIGAYDPKNIINLKLKVKKRIENELTEQCMDEKSISYLNLKIDKILMNTYKNNEFIFGTLSRRAFQMMYWYDLFPEEREPVIEPLKKQDEVSFEELKQVYWENRRVKVLKSGLRTEEDVKINRMANDEEVLNYWTEKFDELEKTFSKTEAGQKYEKYWKDYWNLKEENWRKRFQIMDNASAEKLIEILKAREKILEQDSRLKDYIFRKEQYLDALIKDYSTKHMEGIETSLANWLKKWVENKKEKIIPEKTFFFFKEKKRNEEYARKNFFDSELQYIYKWSPREDNPLLEEKADKNPRYLSWKEKIINLQKKNKKKINRNYNLFYKKLIFENNLEKWENNTKIRASLETWTWFHKESLKFRKRKTLSKRLIFWYSFVKNIFLEYRDRLFNHNRTLFWTDVSLEKESKITYYFAIPRVFIPIFFIIRFAISSLRLWNWAYWINRWRQYVVYGIHSRVDYKSVKNHLRQDWTLEWYRDSADYGLGLYYKDFREIIDKFNLIKNTPVNKKQAVEDLERSRLISKIIKSTYEHVKYDNMLTYKISMNKIEENRKINTFENRFNDIRIKLSLDIDKVSPKKWAEQKLMYKYRNEAYTLKLKLEESEYADIKNKYSKTRFRDKEEKEKSLVIIEWEHQKSIDSIMKGKLDSVAYEKKLREFNFENRIVDHALDAKERIFFELIPEYNEDLKDAWQLLDEETKADRLRATEYEKKSKDLYGILETRYVWYRWYTTMGARFGFVVAQIGSIFLAWLSNLEKVHKNEFTLESLTKIMYIDVSKFIYKMYWEYLIIGKKYKTMTKLGLGFIDILKFSLILSPLIIYTGSLYILFYIYFIYKYSMNLFVNKINVNILQHRYSNLILKKLRKIKTILSIIFKNVETGETIFDNIYNVFYKFCGLIQRNCYFIKGAFILGYRESGFVNGLTKVFYLFTLKYKAGIEKLSFKLKKIKIANVLIKIKNNYLKQKENVHIKAQLIIVLLGMQQSISELNSIVAAGLYNIFAFIFKMDINVFRTVYEANTILFWHYYSVYFENLVNLFQLVKRLTIFEFIILFFKWIFILITLPIIFVIDHQKWKYAKNYNKGIQGFRNNSMYRIIDRPRLKNDWRLKLHNILVRNKISNKLYDWQSSKTNWIDEFLMYKIDEVRWTNKNIYQESFWREAHWYWTKFKDNVLGFLYDWMYGIEEGYYSFEESSIEFQNFSFWERIKYSYFTDTLERDMLSYKEQKKVSRDLFFKNQIQEKHKLQRVYFIKGLLNWLSYLISDKVIFTKVEDLTIKPKNLKHKGFKFRHIKYKHVKVPNTVHLTKYLKDVPPQLWSLVVLYDIYFQYIARYRYQNHNFPKDWKPTNVYTKDYKWRLAAPDFNTTIPFTQRRPIALDHNTYHFNSFGRNLETKPYDPMIRWAVFLLEYGIASESIAGGDYDHLWSSKEDNSELPPEDVWGDISMAHLLTYDQESDAYKYEIKDYNRLFKALSWSFFKKESLGTEKMLYYREVYSAVSKRIMEKNKDLLDNFVKERRLLNAVPLNKALLRNEARTEEEKEAILEEERYRDFFYTKSREVFEEWHIEHYWDWKADFESKPIETKYFGTKDLDSITRAAKLNEEFYNSQNIMPASLVYLVQNIVLQSYDETVDDILGFLQFKVWKCLDKAKGKKVINYKNLYIRPSFFKKINYLEYKKQNKTKVKIKKKVTKIHKVTKAEIKQIIEEEEERHYISYKYRPLDVEWQTIKYEPLFNFIENNYFQIYFETGELFTYQDKIDLNRDAMPYKKNDPLFHGNEEILNFYNFICNRKYGLKHIRKSILKKNKRKIYLTIGYINNIRWSWEQWLGYADVNEETQILNKNIIILNERYRLWNLKRGPIRLKLPVVLGIPEAAKSFFAASKNYATMEHRFYLLCRSVRPLIRDSLRWWLCKEALEKLLNQNITDIVFWVFRTGAFNSEVDEIKRKYAFILKHFVLKFSVFSKLYFVGMPQYSWDLLRYLDMWVGEDEPPIQRYFVLKQMEYMNHDPITRQIMKKLHNLGFLKYSPTSFIYFFKYQYLGKWLYYGYGLGCVGSVLWFLKVLFYNPGEYIANYYMLMTPIFTFLIFWILRRHLRDVWDVSRAVELYLYRYQKSRYGLTKQQWRVMQYDEEIEEYEQVMFIFNDQRRLKVFGTLHPEPSVSIYPEWWRSYSHEDKDSEYAMFKHLNFFAMAFLYYFIAEYWGTQKYKYRNSPFLWDFFYLDPVNLKYLQDRGIHAPVNYFEKEWLMDSFLRLESGGNLYTRWYENFYRVKLRHNAPMPLDYGYSWQTAQGDFFWLYTPEQVVSLTSAYSDASWLDFCSRIIHEIPEELKVERNYAKYKQRHQTHAFKKKVLRMNHIKDLDKKKNEDQIINPKYEQLVKDFLNLDVNPLPILYKEFKIEFKQYLIRTILGAKYTRNYDPLKEWMDFIHLMKEVYNFDVINTLYSDFLFKNKLFTKKLIMQDYIRYISKKDSSIFDYSKFINRKKELFFLKKKSFETGEPLDIKVLLSITEPEKHLQVFYYNFVKYKSKRLDGLLKCSEFILTKSDSDVEYLIKDKSELDFLLIKQSEQYIINIFKTVSYQNKLEYKYNVLSKLWSDSEISWWSWCVIKNIIKNSNFSELLDLFIKLINSM